MKKQTKLPHNPERAKPLINILITSLFSQTLLLDPVYLRFSTPSLTTSTVLALRGSVPTAAFSREMFRACPAVTHAKDAGEDLPSEETCNSKLTSRVACAYISSGKTDLAHLGRKMDVATGCPGV